MPRRPRLLLHACCGPCATAVVESLLPDYHVTLLWFNPNIHPEVERQRRLASLRLVADYFDTDLIEEPEDEDHWLQAVAGLEDDPEGGPRCSLCFRFRLDCAARLATRLSFDCFATTLTVSPHKSPAAVNAAGAEAAAVQQAIFLPEDFKQKGRFQRSIELSRQLGLYRQRYCGCRFTLP